jgi:hypothetical protein
MIWAVHPGSRGQKGTGSRIHNTLNIEYQSVCPYVQIGSRAPLSRNRVCPPPSLEPKGGRHSLAVRGRVEPIRTTGEKAWLSVYTKHTYKVLKEDQVN